MSARCGYLACAWCLLFAALHCYWALGGSAGSVSSAGRELAAKRPAEFVLYGLWGVAALLVVGSLLGVALTRARFGSGTRRVVLVLGLLAAVVLLLRGLLLELVLLFDLGGVSASVGPMRTRDGLLLWNPWFVAGGLLFLSAVCGAGWRPRSSSRMSRASG